MFYFILEPDGHLSASIIGNIKEDGHILHLGCNSCRSTTVKAKKNLNAKLLNWMIFFCLKIKQIKFYLCTLKIITN